MAKKNDEKVNAIGYVRVSTQEQAQEGVSLEAQKEKIESYAKLHGLNLVDLIVDAGLSGKNLKRDGIQSLLSSCKSRKVNHVIVVKMDRLTRSVRDLLYVVEDVFTKNHVEFHSINERIDTSSAQGRFFLTIMGAMSEMERGLISERTAEALTHIRKSGRKTGGDVPFGFKADDNGYLEEYPKEQEIISIIKELREDGLSLRKIADRVNEMGYSRRNGGKWNHQYIDKVLKAAA